MVVCSVRQHPLCEIVNGPLYAAPEVVHVSDCVKLR